MAEEKHVEKLKEGVHVWNAWRVKNYDDPPDPSNAALSGMDLCEATLFDVNLSGADLPRSEPLRRAPQLYELQEC